MFGALAILFIVLSPLLIPLTVSAGQAIANLRRLVLRTA
jgi:hypothetical protein